MDLIPERVYDVIDFFRLRPLASSIGAILCAALIVGGVLLVQPTPVAPTVQHPVSLPLPARPTLHPTGACATVVGTLRSFIAAHPYTAGAKSPLGTSGYKALYQHIATSCPTDQIEAIETLILVPWFNQLRGVPTKAPSLNR